MKIEVLKSRASVAAVEPRWSELARADPRDGFFRTPAWYMAWMDCIRKDAEPFVLVARDGENIAGVAPLCQAPYRDLGFRLTGIAWGGREVVSGDFLDLVAEPARRAEVTEAVFRHLEENLPNWGLLVMGELVEGGETHRALERMAERAGLPLRTQEARTCPYIELPGTFDEYLGSLGSSTRYHIRRRMRDTEKLGCRVVCHSRPDALAANLGALIRLHVARWRNEGQSGTLGRPGFAEFLREICTRPPEGAGARLYVLECQGAPAAALLAFHFGQSALYYQAGWDPDSPAAAHSPGVVLMAHSIRDAIEAGARYYDFLRGEEAYKTHWTKTCRNSITVLAARGSLARQYLRVAGLKDLVMRGNAQTVAAG